MALMKGGKEFRRRNHPPKVPSTPWHHGRWWWLEAARVADSARTSSCSRWQAAPSPKSLRSLCAKQPAGRTLLRVGIKPISIDHAVMEAAARDGRVVMASMDVGWSDIGSWAALREATDRDFTAVIGIRGFGVGESHGAVGNLFSVPVFSVRHPNSRSFSAKGRTGKMGQKNGVRARPRFHRLSGVRRCQLNGSRRSLMTALFSVPVFVDQQHILC